MKKKNHLLKKVSWGVRVITSLNQQKEKDINEVLLAYF
jgi:hypothetical protein